MATTDQAGNLSLEVAFEKAMPADRNVPLKVFLFDKNGTLVDRSDVHGTTVSLDTRGSNPQSLRLLVVPAIDERVKSATQLAELERYKPYETSIRSAGSNAFEILPIPSLYNPIWWGYRCRVRGSVVKSFTVGINTGLKGLCRARVHICEVDRIWWWIDRIPDPIVLRIPPIVLQPVPIPDPIGPIELLASRRPPASATSTPKAALRNAQLFRSDRSAQHHAPASFSAELQAQLMSGDVNQVKRAIRDNFGLFHPYFCDWPWVWPYFYRCEELAVVYTDDFGNFDSSVLLQWGDRPDLYFWVEYLIDGVWTTVYKPSIPCHTYWGYTCGTQITITVTDPRVHWACQNIIPGEVIWMKMVGNGVSVSRIKQVSEVGPTIQGQPFDRIGLTDADMLYSMANGQGYVRPFGTTLYFVAQFGSGLPTGGITYYRWSCQKVANADLSPATGPERVLNDAVYKSYSYEYVDLGVTHFGVKSYLLGPLTTNGVANLFQIPPVSPAMAPVNAAEQSPQWDQNTLVVQFDSRQLDGDGLYSFWMELFDQNGNVVEVPKTAFQVPDPNSFYPSLNAPDINLNIDVAHPANAFSYKMLLRVDNTTAVGEIYPIGIWQGGGYVNASPNCCGFVHYGANHGVAGELQIAFRAFHPQNFAWLSFDVQKGTCGSATSAFGLDEDSVDGYVRDMVGIYRRQFSPDGLLGECSVGAGGDGKAAFAETLSVETLTTNGTTLAFGDAGAVAAFALEP